MSKYKHYENVTKEILDNIKVGNLVKINNWKRGMRVVCVSENYFLMTTKVFGKVSYSVCEKKSWGGIKYNAMRGGMFHCSTDDTIFGYMGISYRFDDEEENKRYLDAFENGDIELSVRRATPIYDLYVK